MDKKIYEELLVEHFKKTKLINFKILKMEGAAKLGKMDEFKKIAEQVNKKNKKKSALEEECIQALGIERYKEIRREIIGN